jgi:uncharacterized membrane protein YccF (DUF307 family)
MISLFIIIILWSTMPYTKCLLKMVDPSAVPFASKMVTEHIAKPVC